MYCSYLLLMIVTNVPVIIAYLYLFTAPGYLVTTDALLSLGLQIFINLIQLIDLCVIPALLYAKVHLIDNKASSTASQLTVARAGRGAGVVRGVA